ncbi:MAG: chemotaxis protein CheA [Pseudomonadota bacterium]
MSELLRQFLAEARDFLQRIGELLLQLENTPGNADLLGEMFRLVHTLKGNCGLFDYPEMARVLHAAEDLMGAVRAGQLAYGKDMADCLFDALDFVTLLLDGIESGDAGAPTHAGTALALAAALRAWMPEAGNTAPAGAAPVAASSPGWSALPDWPLEQRLAWHAQAPADGTLWWIDYRPEPECFFKGEDPFFQARQVPDQLWRRVTPGETDNPLSEFDTYRCALSFQILSTAPRAELEAHFRYVPEQVSIMPLSAPSSLASGEAAAGDAASALCASVIAIQRDILALADGAAWQQGRQAAAVTTLRACLLSQGRRELLPGLDAASAQAQAGGDSAALLAWLPALEGKAAPAAGMAGMTESASVPAGADGEPKFGRRVEDTAGGGRTLKVDQDKIDRLMSLIGEMVVAKNGMPYLAARAESVFGMPELARDIKGQYGVINRIAEEMQDAIMQVRMMPVSFVFQRFPRLVRDLSRKLDKNVTLVLEGEDTEADKNIIEALADPLIHIVRNSLDHGLETAPQRLAAGKPAAGRLLIRASQEADRVVIEISDDGRGIDPQLIRRKACEKGLIDAQAARDMSDRDALDLVFKAGFSSVDVVSDLSGRGVGMDVVRTAVEKVHGSVRLDSTVGRGTTLRLSLPLSMAVSSVIVIGTDGQTFGVPMDSVVETVRVRRSALRGIKDQQAVVLRERIVPLRRLNDLLALDAPQRSNDNDELAVLVLRVRGAHVGIVVDDFREVLDIILKPMTGIMGKLPGYAGTALLGDGSVLMILNPKELL